MTITMTDLSKGILPANIQILVTQAASIVAQQTAGNPVIVSLTGAVIGSAAITQPIVTTLGSGAVNYSNIQNENPLTLLGNPTGSAFAPSEVSLGAGLTFSGNILSVLLQNYISGMTLSNDGGTPNTVLDIASGVCSNSTNTTMIVNNSPFTKSISSAWVAGTGNAGLGNGLTLTASTTYHVFAIINNGLADYYFDTRPSLLLMPRQGLPHSAV